MQCPAGYYSNKTDLAGDEDCTPCDGEIPLSAVYYSLYSCFSATQNVKMANSYPQDPRVTCHVETSEF